MNGIGSLGRLYPNGLILADAAFGLRFFTSSVPQIQMSMTLSNGQAFRFTKN